MQYDIDETLYIIRELISPKYINLVNKDFLENVYYREVQSIDGLIDEQYLLFTAIMEDIEESYVIIYRKVYGVSDVVDYDPETGEIQYEGEERFFLDTEEVDIKFGNKGDLLNSIPYSAEVLY
ncbi:Hypothetical protein ORPV_827 [Orpheovirus IHUMI-LCC2]|uniref:Uncharacterized protein n=1 Tax=Orpheovirus IHUMI-LCC2 TaxID=2023057 RepID=A0A2I2L5E0_9VIRU|nr:Hypothetical protein ORPV_827 [Orpheovirus IHUMI-LCC2]SNW62731.1 Hypothetical protein ORPV_827 [Orpheovirus IHUMI-LCC2]